MDVDRLVCACLGPNFESVDEGLGQGDAVGAGAIDHHIGLGCEALQLFELIEGNDGDVVSTRCADGIGVFLGANGGDDFEVKEGTLERRQEGTCRCNEPQCKDEMRRTRARLRCTLSRRE